MVLQTMQEALVTYQKKKDELVTRLNEIIEEGAALQKEHAEVVQGGQLVEGSILAISKLIEDERAEVITLG